MGCKLTFIKNDKDWDALGSLLHTMWNLRFGTEIQTMKVTQNQLKVFYAWQTPQKRQH